jgi:methylmalonyl-CoA carboxyltransferase 5S subunit
MSTKPRQIRVTDVILRDAHQSLLAIRMTFDDMAPACADLDNAGYWSLECWGGATFDACIRFLNEDPWVRLRKFKKLLPKTPLQMLLRGQNLLGYRHYGDDVVEKFCMKAAENGMDVFRIFDALNDPRNLLTSIKAVKKAGKHAQGTICYTISPVHTVAKFVELGRQLTDLGCDSICIKDMAGLLKPAPAYELVKALKAATKLPIHLHCHATSGVTFMSLYKAIEAGADGVDTSISTLSLGTGHNPTESLHEALEGTGCTSGLDMQKVYNARDHFAKVVPRYSQYLTSITGVDTEIFTSQVPGGMMSNLESQLKQQKAGHRLRECLAEVPKVRAAAGFPPLVTPSSQIIGSQAVFNVLMGPYKNMTGEFADIMLGYYGETSAPVDKEVQALATKQKGKPIITCRPADLIKPEFATLKADAAKLPGFDGSDEDALTVALFPTIAPGFLAKRAEGPKDPCTPPAKPAAPAPAAAPAAAAPAPAPAAPKPVAPVAPTPVPAAGGAKQFQMTVNGRTHHVSVERLG